MPGDVWCDIDASVWVVGLQVVAGLFIPAVKGAHVNTTLLGLNIANNALWYSVEQEEDSLDRAYHLETVGIEALCRALWKPVEVSTTTTPLP
jgi:hypothetical protein